MRSIYISVYILRIFSIYIHISAAIRAIRKIPEDAVQREGGCVSCYSGDSGSRSALSHYSVPSSAVLHVTEIPIDCEGVVHGAAALAQVQHSRQSTGDIIFRMLHCIVQILALCQV